MKNLCLCLTLSLLATCLAAQTEQVNVVSTNEGAWLTVNGKQFMINGMNWDYFPIGTNYSYSLWKQPNHVVRAALDTEMKLLQGMGVNAIRMYTGVPARWITYIYKKYGIYTMLNHPFGRYGLTLEGEWVANTEYTDSRVREVLLQEVRDLATQYQNTPGLLLYLLGNENNYGLFWEGAETEDIPTEDAQSAVRAQAMYKIFNEGASAMKSIDQKHPVAMCNGDLQFLEIIAKECPAVDILGTNMYRGPSFGDAFDRVKKVYGKPILFTEFGADALNAISNIEDQEAQAYFMLENWKEIYAHAAGMGKAGNALGGFTFQFSDGWWKYGQDKNLNIHDNHASWANGGYDRDYVTGQNNMNEEWFGICAKGPTNKHGFYELFPRTAYYVLKEAHQFNPYAPGATSAALEQHFSQINIPADVPQADANSGSLVPAFAAPAPIHDAAKVISLFSEAYPNVPVDTWLTAGSSAKIEEVALAGNPTKKYANLDFAGIELVANPINASGMTHLHVDVWTSDADSFAIKLVDFGANGTLAGGDDVEYKINYSTPVKGYWMSFDIPLFDFKGLTSRAHIAQIVLSGQPAANRTIYIDNLYFHK